MKDFIPVNNVFGDIVTTFEVPSIVEEPQMTTKVQETFADIVASVNEIKGIAKYYELLEKLAAFPVHYLEVLTKKEDSTPFEYDKHESFHMVTSKEVKQFYEPDAPHLIEDVEIKLLKHNEIYVDVIYEYHPSCHCSESHVFAYDPEDLPNNRRKREMSYQEELDLLRKTYMKEGSVTTLSISFTALFEDAIYIAPIREVLGCEPDNYYLESVYLYNGEPIVSSAAPGNGHLCFGPAEWLTKDLLIYLTKNPSVLVGKK